MPVLVAVAGSAGAHIEPILPSLCRFDPVDVSVPGTTLTGSAATASAADDLLIRYDTSASRASFCPATTDSPPACGTPVARAFTLGAFTGSLSVPAIFSAAMLATGDLAITGLPLSVTLDSTTASVAVTLTTGLVAAGGTVLEGAPITATGTFTFVGAANADALGASLAGRSLALRMTCQAVPPPDLDQFALPALVKAIGGSVAGGHARLHAVLAPAQSQTLDLTNQPTLLRVHVGDTTIAAAAVASGLTRSHGRYVGTSTDGQTRITLRKRGSRFAVTIQASGVVLPTQQARARVPLDVTLDTGGALARGAQPFRATANGRGLHRE